MAPPPIILSTIRKQFVGGVGRNSCPQTKNAFPLFNLLSTQKPETHPDVYILRTQTNGRDDGSSLALVFVQSVQQVLPPLCRRSVGQLKEQTTRHLQVTERPLQQSGLVQSSVSGAFRYLSQL